MGEQVDLSAVLDRMESGIFVFQDDTLRYANPALRQLLGWPATATLTLPQLVPAEDVQTLLRASAQSQGPANPLKLRLIDSQGHVQQARLALTPTGWDDELAWLGTILDLRREPDSDVSRLIALTGGIFNIAGVGMMLVDVEGRILDVNPAFQRMLVTTREDLLKARFQDFTHPDDLPLETIFIHELLAHERDHYQIEKRYVRPNGTVFWSRATVSSIGDPDHATPVFLRLVEDITPRKELEHEFLKSLSLMQAVLDSAKDGFVVVDNQGQTLVDNPAFESMWHLPDGWQKLPTAQERLTLMAAQVDDPEAFIEHVSRLFRQHDTEDYNLVMLKDGTVLEHYITPFRIGHLHAGQVWNFRDLADRQRAEAALLEQERLQIALENEQKLNVLKSNLMLTIAHEFRTPLAIIMSASELLERYSDRMNQDERHGYATQIREQIAHFVEVLDDLTIIVKGQEQELDLNLTHWDLHEACRRWVAEIRRRPEYQHRIIFDGHASPCPVRADYSLLRRAITSLVSNAMKYDSRSADIHVDLEITDHQVILKVTDQGIGIPAEDLPHVFEPFYRSGNVGAIQGTGMGLAIVRDTVRRHGGQVTVTSKEGHGAQFTVRLPILDP